MHEKKYIHRDIKLENIFLDKAGNAKLGDFGFIRGSCEVAVAIVIKA